jgi:hypothetical protein
MAFKSKAVSSQGLKIEVETGKQTAISTVEISAAKPAVLTKANEAWELGDVAYIKTSTIAPLVGMSFPLKPTGTAAAGTAEMVGSDTTGETDDSAASVELVDWAQLCETKTFNGFNGQASEIDVTTICSEAKEYRTGLQDFGTFDFDMNYVPTDESQKALMDAKASGKPIWIRVTLPDNMGAYVFQALVRQITMSGGVDTVLSSSVSLRITGAPTFIEPAAVTP